MNRLCFLTFSGFPTWPTISRFRNRLFPSAQKSQERKKTNRHKPTRKKKKRPSLKSKLRSLIKNFQCLRTSLTARSNPKIIEKLSKATQRPKKNTYGSDNNTGDFFLRTQFQLAAPLEKLKLCS